MTDPKSRKIFDKSQQKEIRSLVDARLAEALALPPAIALAADILGCLHDLNGYCALCGRDIEDEVHQADCPLIRHAGLFDLAARLSKKRTVVSRSSLWSNWRSYLGPIQARDLVLAGGLAFIF